MTRYLACEWGPDGIRVNAVAPWFISTPLTAPLLAREHFHAAVKQATPLGRVGEPHEVARRTPHAARRTPHAARRTPS